MHLRKYGRLSKQWKKKKGWLKLKLLQPETSVEHLCLKLFLFFFFLFIASCYCTGLRQSFIGFIVFKFPSGTRQNERRTCAGLWIGLTQLSAGFGWTQGWILLSCIQVKTATMRCDRARKKANLHPIFFFLLKKTDTKKCERKKKRAQFTEGKKKELPKKVGADDQLHIPLQKKQKQWRLLTVGEHKTAKHQQQKSLSSFFFQNLDLRTKMFAMRWIFLGGG